MSYEEKKEKITRRKCFRYALFSFLLIIILIISTGCAALLTGDNKKAYDLLVKASDYFHYPSSVQIVSGEMSGNNLYCLIRAKNRMGYYRNDTYYIYSSGYPLESSSWSCYSEKLNYDLINNALATHYGVSVSSSSNIFSNMLGGYQMSTAAIIITILVVIILNGILSSHASDIANDKGYEKKYWFHMCFWLGPLSYIIIAAMPDLTMRVKQDKTNELLTAMIETYNKTSTKMMQNKIEDTSRKDDISSYLPDL